MLHKLYAFLPHSHCLGLHSHFFVEECRGEEVAVDVSYYDVGFGPVDFFAAHLVEVARLGEVEEDEVNRVVEVTQGVDVVKSQLHVLAVAEWSGQFDAVFLGF